MPETVTTRPLTDDERQIACWMLENGGLDAREYLAQLALAEASTWRCPCGCASFDFAIPGKPKAPPGVHILGDFVFGDTSNLAGIFIFSAAGILSGVEVYGLVGDAPTSLPEPGMLRPLRAGIGTRIRMP